MRHLLRRGAILLAASGIGSFGPRSLCGQAASPEIAGAERRALIDSARNRYYSLTEHGVRSFTCRVHFDFGTIGKDLLPPEDEADRRLLESASFLLKVAQDGPAMTYQFPAGAVSQSQETVAGVTLWVTELIQGFFQTWPPKGFDGPVPQDKRVKDLFRDGSGYRMTVKDAGGPVELRIDQDSVVTQRTARNGAETEHLRFDRTQDGLVYAGGDSLDSDANGRTETHFSITSAKYGGFLLPRGVTLRIGQHVDVRWEMSGCTVERR